MYWLRPPVMAGKFYPKEKKVLEQTLQGFLKNAPPKKVHAKGILVPHAGYMYSGQTAGDLYRKIEVPETVFILCPNHTGRGPRISIWSEGAWETPLGRVAVDESLASHTLQALGLRDGDMSAHASEHAIEVQVPFLQVLNPSIKIIPIVLGFLRYEECEGAAAALAEVLAKSEALLVASSDMSHYVPAEEALKKDEIALRQIDKFEPEGLYNSVMDEDISMCGFIPTVVTLKACQILGGTTATRVSYSTSGDVTGDQSSVVAYANAILT